MKKIILRKNEEKRLLAGHLWIFSNEIEKTEENPGPGEVVELYGAHSQYLGKGFYNPHSLIAFRLLTRDREDIDKDFWKGRMEKALSLRRNLYPGTRSFRAVFGESDLLPGLIVDVYESYLSVQFLSAGLDKNCQVIVEALKDVFSPEGIVGRNDSGLRKLEGLEQRVEILYGNVPEHVKIEENKLSFLADLRSGQKTGYFFDQRENRAVLAGYCAGKKVLDCFCHTGAFGINAARAGASRVVWVDSSGPALKIAGENARLNGMENTFEGIEADVTKYLENIRTNKEKFDIIILDPPALIKSKKDFNAGYRAYKKLNTLGLDVLGPGGILASSSCSHHLRPGDFRTMLEESAAKAGRQVRLLETRLQARDHPVLLSMPETEYLKFAILQVI